MKVACLQMNSGRDIAANAEKLRRMAAEAVARGAQLVASPENTFVMGEPQEGEARQFFTPDDHPGIAAAAQIAKESACWLLVGSVAVQTAQSRAADPKKAFNRSLLFTPQGTLAAHYDKIHLFDVSLPGGEVYTESSRSLPGGQMVVAELPGAKLGMTICYDVRFPHLYRALAKAGAQVLAVPAAFTVPTGEAHWHVLLRARAIENSCFVIAPAQTGTHPGGRRTYGHALIIDPWGRVLADAGVDEGIILAELDMARLVQVRERLPSLEHDRAFT